MAMLRIIAVSALLAAAAATPALAAPGQAGAKATSHVACVPLRDASNRPTGRSVCRTAEQWAAILRANGLQHAAADMNAAHFVNDQAFFAPNAYYGVR
jgi:hypothetical protein